MPGLRKTLPKMLVGWGLCLVLTGCPYHSDVPLAAPSTPIDARLLGSWREDSSSTSPLYTVQGAGQFEYHVVAEGETGPNEFRAHLTAVGDQWFLNLRDSGADSAYSLFRIEIADDSNSFTLFPVTENITETFSQSADLLRFVEQNQGLSFFFERPTRYVRTAPNP